jgi:cytochrome c oxidase subunit II
MKRFAIYTAGWVLASATLMPGATIPTAAPRGRLVEVIADKDNIFKIPGQKKPIIYAKVGEPLHVKITSRRGGESARDGAVHSFVIKKLKDQGWDVRLMDGVQEFDVLAAPTPGEYLIECTVKCGQGHEDMNMKLIVTK